MSFSVNTNSNALAALESLNMTQQSLTKTQNRVSTGLKVAGAADDASTFAIAQGQRGDIAGFQQVSNSLALCSATVNVAFQGATSISDTLNQLKAKVVEAQSATPASLVSIQNDITSLVNQVAATGAASQFNGVNLLQAAGGGAADDNVLSSLNRNGTTLNTAFITVGSQDLTTGTLGVAGTNVADATGLLTIGATYAPASSNTVAVTAGATTTTFEFITTATTALSSAANIGVVIGGTTGQTTANLMAAMAKNGLNASYSPTGNVVISSAAGDVTAVTSGATGMVGTTGVAGTGLAAALTNVETAIGKVQTALSSLGTVANQLTTQTNFVKTLTDTLTAGVGTLVDADLAAESANLQALQTKQQLGIQALSIANQGPGAVLTLFR